MKVLKLIWYLIIITFLFRLSAELAGAVHFNELMINPSYDAANGENYSSNEYIEIRNGGPVSIDISGWSIGWEDQQPQMIQSYTGPGQLGLIENTLPVNGLLLLFCGSYLNRWYWPIYSNANQNKLLLKSLPGSKFFTYGLRNSSGKITLYDRNGNTVDQVYWYDDPGVDVALKPTAAEPFCFEWQNAPSGGTPGYMIPAAVGINEKVRFNCNSKTGSGQKGIQFSYLLLPDETCDLNIYSLHGRLLKSLLKQRSGTGQATVIWNGFSDNGSSISTGCYLAVFTIKKYGRIIYRKKQPFALHWKGGDN